MLIMAMALSAGGALFSIPAPPQRIPMPRMSDAEIAGILGPGMDIESRTDADINLDGDADTVIVGRSDDKRIALVMLAVRSEVDLSHQPVGTLDLPADPLGPATVSTAKGVLKIEDLTGGTTATSTIYRYRLTSGSSLRMRLIGVDATLYSRTFAHDGFELSWNLLTGVIITRALRLNTNGGDAAYDKVIEKTAKRPSAPLYMETTPNADDLITAARR